MAFPHLEVGPGLLDGRDERGHVLGESKPEPSRPASPVVSVQKETAWGSRAVWKGLCHDPRGDRPQNPLFLTWAFGFGEHVVMAVCRPLCVGHTVRCCVALWPCFCVREAT